MPLVKSSSDGAFKKNLKAELASGKPRDQALAIAYSIKRESRAAGGRAPFKIGRQSPMHVGPISSDVPGRTDNHPMRVPAGAYVLPADHVSSLGQGNTAAGMAVLDQMFKPGPKGVGKAGIKRGVGVPKRQTRFADGGMVEDGVDINAAGGEYVIPPEVVMEIGGGDLDAGHKMLDGWVIDNRKQHVKTLRKLPGPAKK